MGPAGATWGRSVVVARLSVAVTKGGGAAPPLGGGAPPPPPPPPADAALRFELELVSWRQDVDLGGKESSLWKRTLEGGPAPDDLAPDHRLGTRVRYSLRDVRPAAVAPFLAPPEAYTDAGAVGSIGFPDVLSRCVYRTLRRLVAGECARVRVEPESKYLMVRDPTSLWWRPLGEALREAGVGAPEAEASAAETLPGGQGAAAPAEGPQRLLADGVQFTVTMHEFLEIVPSHWEVRNRAEMERYASPLRELGNEQYRAGRVRMARKYYRHAVDFLQNDWQLRDADDKDWCRAAQETLWLNIVATALALRDHKMVYEYVLKIFAGVSTRIETGNERHPPSPRPHSVSCLKALVRRAKARLFDEKLAEAKEDATRVVQLADMFRDDLAQTPKPKPGEVAAQAAEAKKVLAALAGKAAEQDRRDRRRFGGLFRKMRRDAAKEGVAAADEVAPAATSTPAPAPADEAGGDAVGAVGVEPRMNLAREIVTSAAREAAAALAADNAAETAATGP
eukprot:TRINITY_DN2770_c0_g1_i1.p1 TRINITY_DN2770_c0_g1~~TRINITY_DN2770_c0_g1_i1.p1  ORF type:complete len:508 (-),score=126.66 TRINITY_DN2770_c0_g1_i1:26-1549(-)